jgi:DNA-binding transcriptional LysR family regulator
MSVIDLIFFVRQMTAEDFRRLQRSEGGGGRSEHGYQAVKVKVELYDGRSVQALVLQGTGLSVVPDRFFLPSKRYFIRFNPYHFELQSWLVSIGLTCFWPVLIQI